MILLQRLLLLILLSNLLGCFDANPETYQIEKIVKLMEKDRKAAEKRFMQLAKKGNADAQAWMGRMILFDDTSINKLIDQRYNVDLARPWLETSIKGGSSLGYFYLGVIDRKHYKFTESNPYLEKAATQNYTPALIEVTAEQLIKIPNHYPLNIQPTTPPNINCSHLKGMDLLRCQTAKEHAQQSIHKRKAFRESVTKTRQEVIERHFQNLQRIYDLVKQGVPYSEEKTLWNRLNVYDSANRGRNLTELMKTARANLLMGNIFTVMRKKWMGRGSVGTLGRAAKLYHAGCQAPDTPENTPYREQACKALKTVADDGNKYAKRLYRSL